MTKKSDLVVKLKSEYPTIKEGSDESGYTELVGEDYDAKISEWADNLLAKESQTIADKVQAEKSQNDKAALLTKLGITAEEAVLLLS
jgi:hypothetical protein